MLHIYKSTATVAATD